MPDTKYSQDTATFDCLGLDLNRPVDAVKAGKFPILENMRSLQFGRLEPRWGLTSKGKVVSTGEPVHSCRRLNDPAIDDWNHIVGAGTQLAIGKAEPFNTLDSGYSGDPLALVPYRPDQSPSSWMYVVDRNRMRKADVGNRLHPIGLGPPKAPPVVQVAKPSYKMVDAFKGPAPDGWVADVAGVASTPTGLARTTSVIAAYTWENNIGAPNWAIISPNPTDGIGVGERLTIDASSEEIIVEDVFQSAPDTTVANILYDDPLITSPGRASLVLAAGVPQIRAGSMLINGTHPDWVYVESVTEGPDGACSYRLITKTLWLVGDLIHVPASFRAFVNTNITGGEGLLAKGLQTVIAAAAGTPVPWTGYITKSTGGLDLSTIASNLAAQPDDYMHISLRVDSPQYITELKIQMDVDATTNDFTRNYYWRSFRASDLTAAVSGAQTLNTARTTAIQNSIINTSATSVGAGRTRSTRAQGLQTDILTTPSTSPAARSQEMATGSSQWCELVFRISDLIRVGTDDTRGLEHVAALRIIGIVTAGVTLDIDAWWIGGGYGPDILEPTGTPYFYRYRARIPSTGARSNWGPATRSGAKPHRQRVQVIPPHYPPPANTTLLQSEIVLDIERFGGEIATWHYIGTVPSSSGVPFVDLYRDDIVAGLPEIGQDHWQPWPIITPPVKGVAQSVSGTTITEAAPGTFHLDWAPGTAIRVNGILTSIYRVISTSVLEVVENMGSHFGVAWEIDEPTRLGQPLPCLWGDEQLGAVFACGDMFNPGRLYFSNGNNPDATHEHNYLDVTSSSEPLMNGVVYNLRAYLFSSERMFQIIKTSDLTAPWVAQEIPNGKGLFSRWAVTRTPAPMLALLAKDGIYGTTGGGPSGLTDADLYPIFPVEGELGLVTNGYNPPLISASVATDLRLDYYDDTVYFDYVDANLARHTLVLALDLGAVERGAAAGGWFYDQYAITGGVIFHYGSEGASVHALMCGGADGKLYEYGGFNDAGAPIPCHFRTPSRNQGDPRSYKKYGDIMLDMDSQGIPITCTPGLNQHQTALAPQMMTTFERHQVEVLCSPAGSKQWTSGRNISLDIAFSVTGPQRPKFYLWETRWMIDPAAIQGYSWEVAATSFGMWNFKHMGLVRITHISTLDLKLDVTLDGVAQPTITIPHTGGKQLQSVFRVPVWKAKIWEIRLTSGVEFRLNPRDTSFQLKEWGDNGPYKPLRIFGDYALVEG